MEELAQTEHDLLYSMLSFCLFFFTNKMVCVVVCTWLARLGSSLSSLLRSSMMDLPSSPESAKISCSASLAGLDSGAWWDNWQLRQGWDMITDCSPEAEVQFWVTFKLKDFSSKQMNLWILMNDIHPFGGNKVQKRKFFTSVLTCMFSSPTTE